MLEGHALSLKCLGSEVIYVTSAHVLLDKASHLSLITVKGAENDGGAHEIPSLHHHLFRTIILGGS